MQGERMTRVTAFSDAHLREAVSIFCDVFGSPPWSEYWTPSDARARIAELRTSAGGRGWSAVDHELAGFALGRAGAAGVFVVEEMAVRADRQCQGIGTTLLRALEADLARQGVEVVEILTQAGKWPCYFYEKNGYHVSHQRPYGVVVLRRVLARSESQEGSR
jgi:aminoglycoside 6'-N-acetyltransferase I